MILTERTINIIDHESIMDSPVVLYRGDKNVELKLNIKSSRFKFRDDDSSNFIESAQASYGQLIIQTPNQNDPIFSEITATKKGYIIFVITAEMIDEIDEVGKYTFQVRLLDSNKRSRATIPPVVNGIEIREPITSEDSNVLNSAVVGLASAANEEVLDTFDEHGDYAKTNWKFGDKITAAKLNKAENGIYQSYALGMNNMSQIRNKINKGEGGVITNDMLSQEVKEAMTGGSVAVVGDNTILSRNIVNGQVVLEKTNFLKNVGNMFNKDNIIPNKKIQVNGTIIDDNAFSISDKIIYDGQDLAFINIKAVIRYDINGNVLGTDQPNTDRPCYSFAICFTKGGEKDVYVGPKDYIGSYKYRRKIPYLSYSVDVENDIENDSITVDKMEFVREGLNIFNKERVIYGYSMTNSGILVSGYNDQFYIDIKIKPNTLYMLKSGAAYGKLVTLDVNKNFISNIVDGSIPDTPVSINTEENACYIRYNSTANMLNKIMICENELPESYERYKHLMPYLEIEPSTAIPDKSITLNMLSDSIGDSLSLLSEEDSMSGANVIGDSIGSSIGLDCIWVQNEPVTTITSSDTYKEMIMANNTSSNSIYQFAPLGINNTGSGEVYVNLVYEVMANSGKIGVFRDNNAQISFSLEKGEHTFTYKTSSTGGYALKYEINLPANSSVTIHFKRCTVLDFANMGFVKNDVEKYFSKYNNYSNVKILKPYIYSSAIPNGIISENMLDDNLYNQISPSKWANKVFVSYGDSNTAGGGWQDYAVKQLGLTHVNKGIGGSTLCGDASSTGCGFSDARINSFPEQVDIVTIMFGTNDWSQNKTIGEDNGDVTTYKGAMGVTIRKIQEKYPMARIIIMSPPFRTDSTWDSEPVSPTRGAGILGFGDCCNEMARKYGCSFIDTYRDMGVNIYNFKNFLIEEVWPVHLNAEGVKRLGRLLVSKLKEIEPM